MPLPYPVRVPHWLQAIFTPCIWRDEHASAPILTFDDGPHPDSTPLILEYLARHELRAVFFILGENAEKYPGLIRKIKEGGHAIGNHGYRHLDGWSISPTTFRENVDRAASFTDTNLFRPPYGHMTWTQYTDTLRTHRIMMWSIMPGDFRPNINVVKRMKRVNQHIKPGDIVVLHDNPKHIKNCMAMLETLQIPNEILPE